MKRDEWDFEKMYLEGTLNQRTERDFMEMIITELDQIKQMMVQMSLHEFGEDFRTMYLILECFDHIAEFTQQIPEALRAKYTNVPWKQMLILKSRVIVDEVDVDVMQLWNILHDDLPRWKDKILDVIADLPLTQKTYEEREVEAEERRKKAQEQKEREERQALGLDDDE